MATDIHRGFPEARRGDVVAMLRAYEASLGISLCFQGFDDELAGLPGDYGPPDGSFVYAVSDGVMTGVAALRGFDRGGGIAEMKRLYVLPGMRGLQLGRQLADAVCDEARRLGYRRLRLDTLPSMRDAQALYRRLGFEEIGNYNGNPVPGSLFFELDLAAVRP